ncbi:hypothetical protein [Shewanella dokdonensis]|uniref:Uncharacterized protein n=1 Tax=Shewanella dokdonensis TaxID=712036 RepID=A0ABX8DIT1_9GAMM|nr:hypothetical protein [Shewanella dokdonensis]MCL1075702.1 hypothetical protein [Shewanella dokdonensis]QVK24689.1 hypothetical protein KHX94_09925 [Shewanella dokdonensis]
MSRLFVWQHKSGVVAIIGTLLSALVFCLALLILPLVLLAGAGLLLALSLFGRRYLKQHMARMQQYRVRASKRDIYDADPHVCRDNPSQWRCKGRVWEHQD